MMRNKFNLVFCTLILLVAAFVFVLWFSKSKPQPGSRNENTRQEDIKREKHHEPELTNSTLNTNSAWTNGVPVEDREWMIRRAKKVESLTEGANVPIVFYGVVIDQFNQPVVGVEVVAIISQWHALPMAMFNATWVTNRVFTDSSGRFAVQNVRGDTYNIRSITKPGYELGPGSPMGFGYGNTTPMHHVPDSSNPVVYKMWRRQGGVELQSVAVKGMIPADGRAVWLDLRTMTWSHTQSPDSVIKVSAKRDRDIVTFADKSPYTWTVEIDPLGGGIQKTDSSFLYEAPEGGYDQRLVVLHASSDSSWVREQTLQFFFKTLRGNFGHGSIYISNWENQTEMYCRMGLVFNPDGTRNLEPIQP